MADCHVRLMTTRGLLASPAHTSVGCMSSPAATSRLDEARATRATWQRYRPWSGATTRSDVLLIVSIIGVVAYGFVVGGVRPFLIASHPVWLTLLTGDPAAIGSAAAFASVEERWWWPVVLAGTVGMVKFDWLTWWAGRQWGLGLVRVVTTSQRVTELAARSRDLPRWALSTMVVLAGLPGVPTPVVYVMAAIAGMRLRTFLALDLLGASLIAGVFTALGHRWGQGAVNLALTIDRYAGWVSLGLIATALLAPVSRRVLRRATS